MVSTEGTSDEYGGTGGEYGGTSDEYGGTSDEYGGTSGDGRQGTSDGKHGEVQVVSVYGRHPYRLGVQKAPVVSTGNSSVEYGHHRW